MRGLLHDIIYINDKYMDSLNNRIKSKGVNGWAGMKTSFVGDFFL